MDFPDNQDMFVLRYDQNIYHVSKIKHDRRAKVKPFRFTDRGYYAGFLYDSQKLLSGSKFLTTVLGLALSEKNSSASKLINKYTKDLYAIKVRDATEAMVDGYIGNITFEVLVSFEEELYPAYIDTIHERQTKGKVVAARLINFNK